MQDELKNVISQAMNTSSEFEHEPMELSDEELEAVAGGVCIKGSRHYFEVKKFWTSICYKNANNLV
jgi:hypothetical protein